MSWKSFAIAVFTHVLFFIAGWFANDYLNPNNSAILEEQIKIAEREKDSLKTEIQLGDARVNVLKGLANYQTKKIDSLKNELKKIRRSNKRKSATIDSLIADDSTRAIEQYRIALQNLGIIPDMSERLTLREIGHGAKFMNDIPSLQLQTYLMQSTIDEQDELIETKDETITELENSRNNWKRMNQQSENQTNLYKLAYENATRFWANRLVASIGIGVNYNPISKGIDTGLQLHVGFRLWGNK